MDFTEYTDRKTIKNSSVAEFSVVSVSKNTKLTPIRWSFSHFLLCRWSFERQFFVFFQTLTTEKSATDIFSLLERSIFLHRSGSGLRQSRVRDAGQPEGGPGGGREGRPRAEGGLRRQQRGPRRALPGRHRPRVESCRHGGSATAPGL